MNFSQDYEIFKIILEMHGYREMEGSTRPTTFFRNIKGSVLSVNRTKENYDDNYLSEMADQTGYDISSLIRIFKTVKKVKDREK